MRAVTPASYPVRPTPCAVGFQFSLAPVFLVSGYKFRKSCRCRRPRCSPRPVQRCRFVLQLVQRGARQAFCSLQVCARNNNHENPQGSTPQYGQTVVCASSFCPANISPVIDSTCAGTGLREKYLPKDRGIGNRWKQSRTSVVEIAMANSFSPFLPVSKSTSAPSGIANSIRPKPGDGWQLSIKTDELHHRDGARGRNVFRP